MEYINTFLPKFARIGFSFAMVLSLRTRTAQLNSPRYHTFPTIRLHNGDSPSWCGACPYFFLIFFFLSFFHNLLCSYPLRPSNYIMAGGGRCTHRVQRGTLSFLKHTVFFFFIFDSVYTMQIRLFFFFIINLMTYYDHLRSACLSKRMRLPVE